MQVEIKVDESCREPKVIILTDRVSEEICEMARKLSGGIPRILVGFQEDRAEVLDWAELYRIFAANGKVYAAADRGEYTLRLRLYELEERMDRDSFVRISNSEIINLKKVKGFDLSFSGTICVTFLNGFVTYVSRRYVSKIRKVLGI